MRYIFLVFIAAAVSCTNSASNKKNQQEIINADTSTTVMNNQSISSELNSTSTINAERPSVSVTTNSNKGVASNNELKNVKLEYKIFKNTETEGYGYDIYIDGIAKVHQPNIPALPGNSGFKTEDHARRIAELAIYKIKNNIMPPTIEVKELDSLGIK